MTRAAFKKKRKYGKNRGLMEKKTVLLVSPGGFCAGVRGALNAFEKALGEHGGPIYVLHELVHNRRVTEDMRRRGAVFISTLAEAPAGSLVLFGAHGTGPAEAEEAAKQNLRVIDACCPRVKRLHHAAAAIPPEKELIIFGNPAHPEVRGVAGHAGTKKIFIVNSKEEIAALPAMDAPTLLCQTTRDHQEIQEISGILEKKYPGLHVNGGMCDAVLRRQRAVEELAPQVDAMIIVGSAHSSNANRMRDVASRLGRPAFLVDGPESLPDLSNFRVIGVGAGASTPDDAVREVVDAVSGKRSSGTA